MRSGRPFLVLLVLLILPPVLFSQTAPVPADSAEPVTSNARSLATPEERSAAMELLNRARKNYNLPEGKLPFVLKVSFNASGRSLYEGAGTMEESWLSGRNWMWTAQIGDHSVGRTSYAGRIYSTSANDMVPLRLYVARDAIFATGPDFLSNQVIRSANANYQGNAVTCFLISEAAPPSPVRRLWAETEYCIDSHSGLLRVWSIAPGIYVTYDYSDSLQFHDHTLARHISIVEDGSTVLDLHLDSLEDTGAFDPGTFKPTAEMMARGRAFDLPHPIRFPVPAASAVKTDGPYSIQPIIVHVTIDGKSGRVLEAEALENSNPDLANEALKLIKGSSNSPMGMEREAFINVRLRLQHSGTTPNVAARR
jgi:hypothetical protein